MKPWNRRCTAPISTDRIRAEIAAGCVTVEESHFREILCRTRDLEMFCSGSEWQRKLLKRDKMFEGTLRCFGERGGFQILGCQGP